MSMPTHKELTERLANFVDFILERYQDDPVEQSGRTVMSTKQLDEPQKLEAKESIQFSLRGNGKSIIDFRCDKASYLEMSCEISGKRHEIVLVSNGVYADALIEGFQEFLEKRISS